MTDLTTNPAVVEVTNGITALEAFAANYQVTTPAQYEAGAADLARVKGMQKKLEDTRTGITGPMNAALKKVNEFFKGPASKLESIERIIKGKLSAFYQEQERKRLAEQAAADERARKEREALEKKAAAAAASGKTEKAEALQSQAATVVAPVIHREPPKVATLQMRDVWRFEITDASKINPAFLVPDEKKIGAQVRALKGEAAAIIGAGVRVWCDKEPASSAA